MLELSIESCKLPVLLLQAEQFFSGVVYTIRVSISSFQDAQDICVIR
jgi:hypothetical protein